MIPLKAQELLQQKFAVELGGPVKIDLFTQKELGILVPGRRECPACKPTQEMLQELAALSDWISLRTHVWEEEREEAAKYGVGMIPATVLRSNGRPRGGGRDGQPLKFFGLPGGTEFPAFIETIVDVSRGISRLGESPRKQLRKLKQDLRLQVFVTPTCPYCPQMARAAYQLGLESPHITAEVVEISEFPELAQRYNVRAVPLTVIGERMTISGAVPETTLVEQVLKAAEGADLAEVSHEGGPTTPTPAPTATAKPPGQGRGSGIIIP